MSHPAKFFELFSLKPNLMAKSMPMSWECLEWARHPARKGHGHVPERRGLRPRPGAEGRAEGRAEGKHENMLATAKRMLKDGVLALKDIARYSGLSLVQVKKLQVSMA